MPADFPDQFIRLGWEHIESEYAAAQPTIRRWMGEAGESRLIELRRAFLRKSNAARGIAAISGRRPAERFGGIPEMLAGDPALEWLPIRRLRRGYGREISFPPVTPAVDDGWMASPVRARIITLLAVFDEVDTYLRAHRTALIDPMRSP